MSIFFSFLSFAASSASSRRFGDRYLIRKFKVYIFIWPIVSRLPAWLADCLTSLARPGQGPLQTWLRCLLGRRQMGSKLSHAARIQIAKMQRGKFSARRRGEESGGRGELGDYPEGSSTVPGSSVPLCVLSKLFARFDSASALALASASNALRDFLFWIFNYPSHTVNWFPSPSSCCSLTAPLLLAAPHQMLFCQLIDCASRRQQQQQ